MNFQRSADRSGKRGMCCLFAALLGARTRWILTKWEVLGSSVSPFRDTAVGLWHLTCACAMMQLGGDSMSDSTTTDAVLRAVYARQQFWIEERDRARSAHNDQVAGDAQRLVDEYEAFIAILKRHST